MELPPWPAKCIMASSSSGAGWLVKLAGNQPGKDTYQDRGKMRAATPAGQSGRPFSAPKAARNFRSPIVYGQKVVARLG